MLKIDYNIPIFEDTDAADLNKYSNEMAKALKTQINNTNNEIKEIDQKVVDAVNKFTEPLSYKGSVLNYKDLPIINTNGDIYTVTSENKNYIWNGTTWEEYASNIDLTPIEDQLKTTKTTAISEALTITDSAGVKGKLDIVNGKSEQETSIEGKNKFDSKNASYYSRDTRETFIINNSNSITVNGTNMSWSRVTIRIKNLKPSTKYTMSAKVTNTSNHNAGLLIEDDNNNVNSMSVNTNFTSKITFITDSNGSIAIQAFSNWSGTELSESVTFDDIQLEEGDIATEFEKFIPNMPSPDYPSDIRNVGDNINKFDISTITENMYIDQEGRTGSSTVSNTSDYIKVKKDTIIILSYDYETLANVGARGICFYDLNKQYLTGATYYNSSKENHFIVANDGYFRFSYDKNCTNIKLEEGSIPTSYSKYNCGSVGFKAKSKNLVNVFETPTTNSGFTLPNLSISKDGFVTYENTGGYRTALFNTFEAEPSTTYYSFLEVVEATKTPMVYLREFNEKMEQLKVSYPKNQTFVTTESTRYIQYGLTTNGYTETGKFKVRPMVVKSNIADNIYKPYEENTVVFPLEEGQLLHQGDYLAKDGIHQVKGIINLNGTENWSEWNITNVTNTKAYVFRNFPTASGFISSNAGCKYTSSHFTFNEINDFNNDEELLYINNLNAIGIRLNINKAPDLTTFKSYLAEQYANGTPVTIEYELAEEIVTPYTPEQEEAYYQLQHLLMYEGYTTIECIDEIKPDIQVTYSYNNEINTSYGKKIDSLEERIRQLEKTLTSLTSEVNS